MRKPPCATTAVESGAVGLGRVAVLGQLLYYEIGGVRLDDAFQVWMLVAGDDDEAMFERADAFVFAQAEFDPRIAVGASARAEELRAVAVWGQSVFCELGREFVDALVQSLEQVLVSRQLLLARVVVHLLSL